MVIDKKEIICLQCGSKELRHSGTRWRGKSGNKVLKRQYECTNCGRVSIKVGIKQKDDFVKQGTINAEEDK